MYLKRIALLLKRFPESVVTFNTLIDNPYRLNKAYEEYDHAALFDFDFNEVEFRNNIGICDKLDKKNRPTKRVYHAYSNVNFDLWLILHKECFNKSVSVNHAYVADVRRIYGLNKTDNIKKESVVKKILNQITIDDVKKAIERAKIIRGRKIADDKKQIGTTTYYSDPDFSIDVFLERVLVECGEIK